MDEDAGADVVVRLHGGLGWFVDRDASAVAVAGASTSLRVPVGAPRSVKDLVECAGVPHVEIEALAVDGATAAFDRLLRGGEQVDVHPPPAPPGSVPLRPPAPAARFACDVHLGRLARRLRQLGFDAWYRADAEDDELARIAASEERVLLSRDRGLLKRRAVVHGYCPRSDDADEQAREVVRRYDLGGRLAPFTRCPRCGAALEAVAKADVLDRLPPRTRVEHDRFARCVGCAQVYWPGSHTTAIAAFAASVGASPRAPTAGAPG